jgi:hypothetical protein
VTDPNHATEGNVDAFGAIARELDRIVEKRRLRNRRRKKIEDGTDGNGPSGCMRRIPSPIGFLKRMAAAIRPEPAKPDIGLIVEGFESTPSVRDGMPGRRSTMRGILLHHAEAFRSTASTMRACGGAKFGTGREYNLVRMSGDQIGYLAYDDSPGTAKSSWLRSSRVDMPWHSTTSCKLTDVEIISATEWDLRDPDADALDACAKLMETVAAALDHHEHSYANAMVTVARLEALSTKASALAGMAGAGDLYMFAPVFGATKPLLILKPDHDPDAPPRLDPDECATDPETAARPWTTTVVASLRYRDEDLGDERKRAVCRIGAWHMQVDATSDPVAIMRILSKDAGHA